MTSTPVLLPILTTLIGSGGVSIGLYSFVSPLSAARIYGIPLSLSESEKENTQTISTSKQEAYIYAHGSRNLAIGTSVIGLTAYWRFSSICRRSPVAEQVVKRCVGIVVLAGSMVPMADAYCIARHVRNSGTSSQDVDIGKWASGAHALRSLMWTAVALTCLLT